MRIGTTFWSSGWWSSSGWGRTGCQSPQRCKLPSCTWWTSLPVLERASSRHTSGRSFFVPWVLLLRCFKRDITCQLDSTKWVRSLSASSWAALCFVKPSEYCLSDETHIVAPPQQQSLSLHLEVQTIQQGPGVVLLEVLVRPCRAPLSQIHRCPWPSWTEMLR